MKILILTPFLPYSTAPAGCPRAVFDRIRLLAPQHAITVVTFAEPGERTQARELRQLGVRVWVVPRNPARYRAGPGLWWKRLRLAAGLLRANRPLLVQEFDSLRARRLIRRLLREEGFDLVLVEQVLMGQYLAQVPVGLPVVFTEHDPRLALPAPRIDGASADWRGVRHWLGGLDRAKWRGYERWVCGRAAAVLVPTPADARLLAAGVPGTRPRVVPFGLAAPAATPAESGARDADSLLFVGNFSHPPNVDAARWLCLAILPRLRAQRPAVQVWLVGRDPPPEVRTLAGAHVHVTGQVPAVAPYLARATLFVAPLRQGGGLRMKLIEALAAGIPVVTTSLGAQGLEAIADQHLLVADGEAAFAEAVLRALADPALRERLGQAGRTLVQGQDRAAARAERLSAILAGVMLAPRLL